MARETVAHAVSRDAEVASAIAAVDIGAGLPARLPPSDIDMALLHALPADMVAMVGPSLNPAAVLFEVFAYPERSLALLIHNFHDLDRLNRGYVLVEAAEILTWAERDMPWNEHCRTPLWPNSDREKTSPGLIFLGVRRAECMKDHGDRLRIAWKWSS